MLRSEPVAKRYFIGYGFLEYLTYEEYLSDFLYWEYEADDEDYIIVSSMEGFRYTIAKEVL